jgi:hypothetical protein
MPFPQSRLTQEAKLLKAQVLGTLFRRLLMPCPPSCLPNLRLVAKFRGDPKIERMAGTDFLALKHVYSKWAVKHRDLHIEFLQGTGKVDNSLGGKK